ncbi:hypothetical protein GWK47_035953 [Chionoecetes opilio]|uniref:Uncharacterized protein n=1 Tax=Chionoecetes opilio TaxID=41210 RepID=A0A8J4YEP4_CHIOP|nr:hypothetical protein GWK47_035953 [Chionoecetes opilio]
MDCATKVCKTFQDLNILATRMNRLYCFIYASRAITRTFSDSAKITASSAKTRSVILVLPTDAPQSMSNMMLTKKHLQHRRDVARSGVT